MYAFTQNYFQRIYIYITCYSRFVNYLRKLVLLFQNAKFTIQVHTKRSKCWKFFKICFLITSYTSKAPFSLNRLIWNHSQAIHPVTVNMLKMYARYTHHHNMFLKCDTLTDIVFYFLFVLFAQIIYYNFIYWTEIAYYNNKHIRWCIFTIYNVYLLYALQPVSLYLYIWNNIF